MGERKCTGSHEAALGFSTSLGEWPLCGVDLIKSNAAGEMIEFTGQWSARSRRLWPCA